MHRLYGMRAYLVGAIDRAPDRGVGWREDLTPFLKNMGVIVLNPCNKPIDIGLEHIENIEYRKKLKKDHNFEQLEKEVKLLRAVDLRMCDIADFIVVNLDTRIYACGTFEEITTANREKKPILIHFGEGLDLLPDWLFGMIPHQFFFSHWYFLKKYLYAVHTADYVSPMKRWMFFDYSKMVPEVTVEEAKAFELKPEFGDKLL